MKKIVFLFALLLLTGCGGVTGETEFKKLLQDAQQVLQEEDWPAMEQQAENIQIYYEEVKWKLQLLGDEDEYESLQESVNHLKQASTSKDKSACEEELSTIETYLQQIYSL